MSQSIIYQFLKAGSQTITVPSGFSNQVLVYAWGAGGGSGTGAPGGGGGYAAGVVNISSGSTVVVSVGGGGGSIVGRTAAGSLAGIGNNPVIDLSGGAGAPGGDPEDNDAGGAGGGGGASAVFVNNIPMIVAAGAGGGGGLGEDWGGGDPENGKGRPGGVATQVNTVPRGADGRRGGAGGAGGGGAGYPFGGDSQRSLYGDDVYSISQGGFGGQNYANASVTSATLVAGSGTNTAGTTNGYYPGKNRGKAGYDGCVILVFQKLFTAWIKKSGAWKQVTSAYVKTPAKTVTTYSPAIVPSGALYSTDTGSRTFTTTSTWTVPPGVTSISATLKGAGGGSDASRSWSGGGGGLVSFSGLAVTPGSTISIIVGTKGSLGSLSARASGGGGGYSAVSTPSTLVAVAGGGGGGGGAGGGGPYGTVGGAGGGNGVGAPGGTGGSSYNGNPGQGGTQSAGGLGGANINRGHGSGTAGSTLQGGAGGNDTGGVGGGGAGGLPGGGNGGSAYVDGSGGGGGGGYFGGGGASSDIWGSGGGGGSGYLNTAVVTQTASTQGGGSASDTDGSITITYEQTTYTTSPTTIDVPTVRTVTTGGWKQIVRGWLKENGVWQNIATPVTLTPAKSETTPTTRARINIVIASNTSSYDLVDVLNGTGLYYPGYSDITLTINAGVTVDSDSSGGAAITIDKLTLGDSLIIVNNGTILGRGGYGGAPGYLTTVQVGSGKNVSNQTVVNPAGAGGPGGTALAITYVTTLQNNGNIYAGGGGGGGGGIGYTGTGAGQGGGGAGYGPGANAGTLTAGGAGAGYGGAGGTNGANGVAGTQGPTYTYSSGGKYPTNTTVIGSAGGAGGIGGKAITGNALVTYGNVGTIVGPRA